MTVFIVVAGIPAAQELGDEFVDLYCLLKQDEYHKFQEIVTPWEREVLMYNV